MKKNFGWWMVLFVGILVVLIYNIPFEKKVLKDENLIPGDFVDEPAKGYVEYSENLNWIWNDVNKALKIAREDKKLVLVDFWAKWCYWCIEMDKDTYADERVEKVLKENFVYVKVDYDRYPKIARFFGIAGLPTALILDEEGNILVRITGYRDPEDIIQILEKYING